MRWSALSTVEAAGLAELAEAARVRADDPSYLPHSDPERDDDEAIARAAIVIALRRHAGRSTVSVGPGGRIVERSGVDLRQVGLLVASGGVLRHGRDGVADPRARRERRARRPAARAAGSSRSDPDVVVDTDSVLAAVGLLATAHPEAARSPGRVAARGHREA